jgi:rSAM/selenodomain-associated transferase 1
VKTGVGVMARAPSAEGKTRLAPHVSSVRLRALRSALLADTLFALRDVPDLVIFFTPEAAEQEIAAICDPRIPRVPQGSGDLGARMLEALQHLLDARRFDAAILIGTDSPGLDPDLFEEAAAQLQASGGIVLGPADDGGYYLVGMKELYPRVFEGIGWGTGTVLVETIEAAHQIDVRVHLTRRGYDIDTVDDLRRLERDLERAPADACPHLRRWFSGS